MGGFSGAPTIVRLRNNVDYRRLLNQDDVAACLACRGFTAVDPGSLSFAEQAALFGRADIIVGVHGAALAGSAKRRPVRMNGGSTGIRALTALAAFL